MTSNLYPSYIHWLHEGTETMKPSVRHVQVRGNKYLQIPISLAGTVLMDFGEILISLIYVSTNYSSNL